MSVRKYKIARTHLLALVMLLLIQVSTSSCAILSMIESDSLKSNLEELFNSKNVPYRFENCQMLPDSRTGVCRLQLNEKEVKRLSESLGLAKIDYEDIYVHHKVDSDKYCKLIAEAASNEKIQIYQSEDDIQAPDTVVFSELTLIVNPQSGHGCIICTYAYG